MERARLCLNMIVKNEAKILERCLASVAPWIDAYAICDTGSTDGTPELIEKFFAERDVPGVVSYAPFEDFSQARNAALEAARALPIAFDYVLFSDADMELMVDAEPAKEWRARLSAPVYLVRQVAENLDYGNVRLVKRSHPCRYISPTHEYLDTGIPNPPTFEDVWFLDHCEGSNRVTKSERDRQLLMGALRKNPNDSRALFYLAQTLKDLGRWHDALRTYDRRICLGGFQEEVWYASFMKAHCYKELKDEPAMLQAALNAFQMRPSRTEPLLFLARYYREHGKNDIALLLSQVSKYSPMPKDILFVDVDAYDYGFRNEIAITGFYSASPEIRAESCRQTMALSLDPKAPYYVRNLALHNSVHFARSVTSPEVFGSACELSSIVPLTSPVPAYVPMNPSIATADGEIVCNVRWVNYRLGHPAPGGFVRTENQIVRIDPLTLRASAPKLLVDKTERGPGAVWSMQPGSTILGYEDCRLFRWKGAWWASATVRDRHPSMVAEIVLLRLRETDTAFEIVETHVQRGVFDNFVPTTHEKNWTPLVRGDELLFLRWSDPLTVLRIETASLPNMGLQPTLVSEKEPEVVLHSFRGSSQAIPFDLRSGSPSRATDHGESKTAGWLYVTHEAFDHLGPGRHYTHRLIWLDAQLKVGRVSDPFYFGHKGVEFNCGLAWHPDGRRLLFSFGVSDCSAHLAVVDQEAVRAFLGRGWCLSEQEG